MWKYYNNTPAIYCLLLGYLFFTACAKPVSPTGGPRDEEPPQVVLEDSEKNMQTNFTKRSFELTFNEWIKLNDVFNQVVVSPPLEHKPTIKLKKKTVRFSFDEKETLRENATYVINFGESVQDYTEGKPAENLRFVFSTGDYIDSLIVKGKVIDAFSGDPVKDVIIMLYDNLEDSVVHKERPFYFGKTDEQGAFKIENIRADTFKIFALVDKNFNYLFDLPSEKIAYQAEPFILTDSTKVNIELALFEQVQPLRLVTKKTDRYGKATLIFNKPPDDDLLITFDSVLQRQYLSYEQDSVQLWYQPKDSVEWSIYLQRDTFLYDTIKVKAASPTAFLAKAKLTLQNGVRTKIEKHNRTKAMEIAFNHPIAAVDTSAFVLLEDTLEIRVIPNLRISVDTPNIVQLRYKWKEDKAYQLIMIPGAVTDWYGLKNDSIPLPFTIPSLETFGNVIVHMTNLKKDMPYVIQLFSGKKIVDEVTFQADSIFTKKYIGIAPGTYDMRVIEDENGNGRWNPGNYTLKTQSENLYFRKLGELRANWDLEVDFSMVPTANSTPPVENKKPPKLLKGKE